MAKMDFLVTLLPSVDVDLGDLVSQRIQNTHADRTISPFLLCARDR